MRRRAGAGPVKAGLAAVVVLMVVGAGVSTVSAAGGNPVKSHPAPRLFAADQIAPLAELLARQKPLADQAFATWVRTHPGRDDAAFSSFALGQLPPPPNARTQQTELAELRQLAASRTAAGLDAAAWLEVYGKKDVWKLYLGDAVELAPSSVKTADKAAFKSTTALAQSLAGTAEARFARHSPGEVDPALRKGLTRRARPSYPSKHAVDVYAELTLLRALDPGRSAELQQMADEVAYSRLYSAGHFRSDLVAGAFLGYLVGDYEVHLLHLPAPAPSEFE